MHSAKEPPETSAAQAIDFLMLLQNLKVVVAVHGLFMYTPVYANAKIFSWFVRLQTIKRTGWVRSGVAGPESIADHMYRMGMMALLAGNAGVDTNRCRVPIC